MSDVEWNIDSDGEDPTERNAWNIEEAVLTYRDEAPVLHNVLPDSDSEEEEEDAERCERDRNRIYRSDGSLHEGQIFYNGIAFKDAVLDHALRTGRNIKQYRYDRTKLGYSCVGEGCEWRVYCSSTGRSDKWQITVFKNVHTCVPNGECEMVKVPVIARLFLDKIREEPEYYMAMKIEEMIKQKWKISVTRSQCQAARNKAMKWIDIEYGEQFARLRDYGKEILDSNPGSSVEIDTIPNEEGLDVFNRFYVCFDNVRRAWKENCRPLLGVDGCFMRADMKGQILVALGRDGDNAIYPVAWAVVQVENRDNWLWFMKKIKSDLLLEDGEGYVLISDRQKGLITAVEKELPRIEHRMCVRHIYANLKSKHGKKQQMKLLIWNLAWSYNEAEYQENMDRLLNYDTQVWDDVKKMNPRTWCRAFYRIGSCCEDVENNSTESWNSSIVKAREKPLVPMLETIARLAMVRIAKRDVRALAHIGICTPYTGLFLAAEHKRASECMIHRSTNMMYDAEIHGCSYRVNLEKRTCSCRKWDITGIPCEHAYGVIMSRRLEVEEYVAHWFRTTTWRRTYAEGIVPLRGSRFWPSRSEPPVHQPPPPPQPGRKKKSRKEKRKRGRNESPSKKKQKALKRIMHCRICGEANHNSRFHKKDGQEVSQEVLTQNEASQGVLTQSEASQGVLTQSEASQGVLTQSEAPQLDDN